MTLATIGIGANLGDAQQTVRDAIAALGALPSTAMKATSSLFRTAPIDADGEDYINAVAQLETALTPEALLEALFDIERRHGRERSYVNAPRTLDLDLLLYGERQIATPTLTVPHPRMTQRAFVLIPLLQLDPFLHIPGHGAAHAFVPAVADQAIQKIT